MREHERIGTREQKHGRLNKERESKEGDREECPGDPEHPVNPMDPIDPIDELLRHSRTWSETARRCIPRVTPSSSRNSSLTGAAMGLWLMVVHQVLSLVVTGVLLLSRDLKILMFTTAFMILVYGLYLMHDQHCIITLLERRFWDRDCFGTVAAMTIPSYDPRKRAHRQAIGAAIILSTISLFVLKILIISCANLAQASLVGCPAAVRFVEAVVRRKTMAGRPKHPMHPTKSRS